MTDILDILQEDQAAIRDLFERIDRYDGHDQVEEREALFRELCSRIDAHCKAKEDHFYKRLEGKRELRMNLLERLEEHAVFGRLVRESLRLKPSDDVWVAKYAVLKRLVDAHFREEERSLFTLVAQVIAPRLLVDMVADYERARGEELQKRQIEFDWAPKVQEGHGPTVLPSPTP